MIPWRPGRADFTADKCTPDGRLPDATKKSNHLRDIFYRMGESRSTSSSSAVSGRADWRWPQCSARHTEDCGSIHSCA